ncbi:MAG: hypothetical protein Kow0068_04620 [Marinilabiliales bacterium]
MHKLFFGFIFVKSVLNQKFKVMRILVFALLIIFGSLSMAQTFSSDNGPVISWENDVYDFGKIKKDKPVTCVFKFRNDGLKPLIITNVESSCGCTVPEYPKKPVKPMSTGEIKATYDAKKLGTFSKSVTVSTNASEKPKVLILKGEVIP